MISTILREEVKNRVREAADIVQVIGEYVELKKAGARFTGLCPFHAEKTPSFSVNPQSKFFHCFGCGESGDVFSFLMKYSRLTFPEALETVDVGAGQVLEVAARGYAEGEASLTTAR